MAYYHCVSRIVDRRFVLEASEKEIFVRIRRGYLAYCGVRGACQKVCVWVTTCEKRECPKNTPKLVS